MTVAGHSLDNTKLYKCLPTKPRAQALYAEYPYVLYITAETVFFNNSKSHRPYQSQPNLLGAGLLVPPNFNLVASVNFTILFLMFLPSLPMITLLAASLPGPKPLYTISSFLI